MKVTQTKPCINRTIKLFCRSTSLFLFLSNCVPLLVKPLTLLSGVPSDGLYVCICTLSSSNFSFSFFLCQMYAAVNISNNIHLLLFINDILYIMNFNDFSNDGKPVHTRWDVLHVETFWRIRWVRVRVEIFIAPIIWKRKPGPETRPVLETFAKLVFQRPLLSEFILKAHKQL